MQCFSFLSTIFFQEKLFLTAANVQSAMTQLDSLPDPWVSPSH